MKLRRAGNLSILVAAIAVTAGLEAQTQPPQLTISNISVPNGEVNVAYPYPSGQGVQLFASGGYAYQWTIAGGALPDGLTLNPTTGVIGGPNQLPTRAANYQFTVQVSCDCFGATPGLATFNMTIFAPLKIVVPTTPSNAAPTTPALASATVGQFYAYNLSGQGGDPTAYSWTLNVPGTSFSGTICLAGGLPPGFCLTPSGILYGTPTVSGNYSFPLQLNDSDIGNSANLTVSLDVQGTGSSPSQLTISSPSSLNTIALGGSISKAVTANGGTPPYTFTATGLPAGVALIGNSVSGVPSAPGVYNVTLTVTDAAGHTAATTINISVLGLVTASLSAATTSSPYSVYLTAAGGTPPYTFSATGLPAGFSITNGGRIGGTATAPGNYNVAVTVVDSNNVSSTASLPLAVALPLPLTVTGGALSGGTVSAPYSQTLPSTGGASPLSWTPMGGSLPNGTSLQSGGTVIGTPYKAGSYTFTARATDQTGASAIGTFSVNIVPQPVIITTPSPLTSGMVTVDYPEQVLSVSGGTPPYTLTVSANTLPAGLALSSNGVISGTPAAAGNFSFTVSATDSNSQSASATFQIKIRAFSTDLILSAGSLSFSLPAGNTGLPPAQSVQVQSTDVTKFLSWSTAVTPASTWLSVTSAGTPAASTPGFFSVALTSAASALAPSSTPYQTTIVASCVSPSPCAGSSQTIAVSLLVSTIPPELTVETDLLSFVTSSANPQSNTQSVVLANTGGGSIGFASVACGAPWCEITSPPSSFGSLGTISVTADPTGLSAGYYYTDLTIDTSAGAAVVPITFFIGANPGLALNPSGVQWVMTAGGAVAIPHTSFLVDASGAAPIAWTAAVLPGAPWLNLGTTSGTSTDTAPGAVNYSINQTVAAGLTPQVYYGTIRVTSAGAVNSPQDFQVVLDVTAPAIRQAPNPTPAGLFFTTTATSSPAPQTDQVFVSSVSPVNYQASASTVDGNPWLSVSSATGITSASSPAQTSIQVSPGGLAIGVYRGSVSYALATAAVRTVNVTLVVDPAGHNPAARAVTSCTPTQIVPTHTSLVNNFAAAASWPTQIEIQLDDDCGNPVTNGQIVTTFSNGDPPLALGPEKTTLGLYAGTWTPRTTGSQVTVTATATAPGFSAARALISGAVVPTGAPVLAPNGTLNVFTPELGGPLAPGTIVQIYGSALANQTVADANIPLPTVLAGTSVVIGGVQAPLFFVSPGQINAQVPFELAPGQSWQVIVNNNGALTAPESIQSLPVAPGVAALPSGYANAQHAADGSAVTDASPAKPGEYIVLYLAGLGPTSVTVATGSASPSNPLAQTVNATAITLGSQPVSILFSGLTPRLAGLYQIDMQVPANAPNGDLTLTVSEPGLQPISSILPVHN